MWTLVYKWVRVSLNYLSKFDQYHRISHISILNKSNILVLQLKSVNSVSAAEILHKLIYCGHLGLRL